MTTKALKKQCFLGAHTSAAGGSFNALIQGKEIGATSIQLFTSNQKQWKSRTITEEEVEKWKALKKETGISQIMSHASYLINIGSPKEELKEKSIEGLANEIKRCHLLEIDYLNFHPGAATTGTKEECLEAIIDSLISLKDLIKKGKTLMVLEATAGQGTTVGSTFEELGEIVKGVKGNIPIGVCIDTCHIFAAGYDIRTKKAWEETLKEFDKHIGLKYLVALHLNDSKFGLGLKKDRHELLGKGEIGMECFKVCMQNKHLAPLPKYLETPDPQNWASEIKHLRKYL
ncbi:MAG: Endonuclease 4 [Chlamydiia bacterium]|nr:Endonuclease 4 [Chlamydiia bacterium]